MTAKMKFAALAVAARALVCGPAHASSGWGLGLALVRQIADRYGASVRQETPTDGGARFIATSRQGTLEPVR